MATRVIGALWSRTSKDGRTKFLSGMLNDLGGDIQITIFKNNRKEKENQPDYNIVLSEKKPERKPVDNGFGGGDEFIDEEPVRRPAAKISQEEIPVMEDDPNGTEQAGFKFPEENAQDEINVKDIPF
jgi:hypothetical protein